MRSLLNALLLIAFGDLVAQPIFTYPQALSATEEVGIQWYEAQTYTYTGGLNGYFNSSTTTWDLSGGTFLDRDTLGISYFSDASTMLAEQWPTANLFRCIHLPGEEYQYGEAFIVTTDSVVYVGLFVVEVASLDTFTQSAWQDPVLVTEFPFSVDDTLVNTAGTNGYMLTDTIYGLEQGVLITPLATHPVASLIGKLDNEADYEARFCEPTNCMFGIADWVPLGTAFQMTYYVRITGLNTGLVEFEEPGVTIFPNPTAGELTLRSEVGPITSLQVFDATGRCVATKGACGSVCDIHLNLTVGTYFLVAHSAAGAMVRQELIVTN
ncbi:MAG: T9SS type A sorting domain-containing protein [Flavobacteriales bacterium]|nr:T9SS type A sorting domain-containing protein [Flavobacteriales bacterium]MBP6641903.1 T9SS type A sorting domain-containing protein [Flavobacteriales bacterium]MBP7156282.1 T9SS type A sorting domain-containing protein [Flavobacteriales bacterium]